MSACVDACLAPVPQARPVDHRHLHEHLNEEP